MSISNATYSASVIYGIADGDSCSIKVNPTQNNISNEATVETTLFSNYNYVAWI